MKNFFEDLFKNKDTKTFNPKLIIILLVGIALMLISNFYSDRNQSAETFATQKNNKNNSEQVSSDEITTSDDQINSSKSALERSYEKELQQALEQMSGVNNVTVIVKLSSTERSIYEKKYKTQKKMTDETDKNNGKRNIDETLNENEVIIIKDGNKEIPLLIEKDMPEVSGVLIVAEGVGKIQVKAKVIEAVTRVFSVESHRVAVMEK
ncbi:MAG: stage sporulation protein [Bacillales bacterium]|nr:stage sporulation protein [Bacillales bacterium]